MIANDLELQTTRERISFFYGILMQMRVTTQPEFRRIQHISQS